MNKVLQFFVFFSSFNCCGQINEFFSDGNATHEPMWFGNVIDFKIEEGKLQSAKTEINTKFYFSSVNELVKNTQWTLNADLLFNPSGVNYVEVFLTASDTNLLSVTQNGYFVRLGGTKDEICLYKKVSGTNTLLIDGEDGSLNKSSNSVKLKVTCDRNFKWELSYENTTGFIVAGTVQDSSILFSRWFGFAINQSTSGFFGKHIFDEVIVAPIVVDTAAPTLLSADFQGASTIILQFNEPLDTSWAKRKGIFELYNKLGARLNIESLMLDPGGTILKIQLAETLAETGVLYFSILEAKDRHGNIAKKINSTIYFSKAVSTVYKDLIITEFMIDPVPSAGLPEKEFIEIYNRSGNDIDLTGYKISDPTISSVLPAFILTKGSYLILCKSTDTSDFKIYGRVLGLSTIPSLNNSEDDIRLNNKDGKLIDRVNYFQTWYKNTSKDDGGYSLELMDPGNICLGKNNWQASTSVAGGTPGILNSVNQSLKDSISPKIREIIIKEENKIDVVFDEIMDSSVFEIPNFLVTPSLSISNIYWKHDSLDKVSLEFATAPVKNTDYTLLLKKAKDCTGNEASSSSGFIVTDIALKGEVLINELLFNPYPFGFDFIEIYNNSDKALDLKGWKLGNYKNDTVSNKLVIFSSSFVLKPSEYLVLTENKQNVRDSYSKTKEERVIELKSLPSFNDDEGSAILLNNKDEIIDRFDYNESMHSPFITNKQGVSLEKINPSLSSADHNSWTSASKEAGYATPGYINSQTLILTAIEDLVEITPNIITPNQDGDNDIMIIRLRTDKAGSLRNLHIYDISGRIVKHLERNNYASTATLVQWDGSDDSNRPVPIGHYILWIEVIDKEGNVNHLRKKVVVGDRF